MSWTIGSADFFIALDMFLARRPSPALFRSRASFWNCSVPTTLTWTGISHLFGYGAVSVVWYSSLIDVVPLSMTLNGSVWPTISGPDTVGVSPSNRTFAVILAS